MPMLLLRLIASFISVASLISQLVWVKLYLILHIFFFYQTAISYLSWCRSSRILMYINLNYPFCLVPKDFMNVYFKSDGLPV